MAFDLTDYPYEIHLTIDGGFDFDIDTIKEYCNKAFKTKLVMLDLYRKDVVTEQVTTSTYVPVGVDVYKMMASLVTHFRPRFRITRKKIETVPWHPFVEGCNPKRFDRKEIYFESHYKWLVPTPELDTFRNSFVNSATHLSRNSLKHPVDGETAIMGTVRTFDRTFDAHKEVLEKEESRFTRPFIKKVSEFAFYDTKRSLDTSWLRK